MSWIANIEIFIAENYLHMTDKEMAKTLCVNYHSLRSKRLRMGLDKSKVNQAYINSNNSLAVKALAYSMRMKGFTLKTIAAHFGKRRQTIAEWVKLFEPYIGDNSITITKQSKI